MSSEKRLVVEKDVPIPEAYLSPDRQKLLDVMLSMKHGDSIFFDNRKKMNSFLSSSKTYLKRGKLIDCRFVTRSVSGGWRVWKLVEPRIPITAEEGEWLSAAEDMDAIYGESAGGE